MYTTIVVGTDGSERAGVAVRQATELAGLTGAALHVVHAYQPVNVSQVAMAAASGAQTVDMEATNAGLALESERIVDNGATNCRRQGIDVKTHSRAGDPAEVLLDVATELRADLIVIGNRGMAGVRRFVLGSVPNKISHHCPCSLLIVDTS